MSVPVTQPKPTAADSLASTWEGFWFPPADSRPLALVRIVAGVLGLLACGTYGFDLVVWFGPDGLLPIETVASWRAPAAMSLFDACETTLALRLAFAGVMLLFGLLAIGLLTPVVAVLAAVGWASLLHRGPMLAGPADDCLAILLWCVAIGTAGEHYSVDAWLHRRLGWSVARPRVRTRLAFGLLQVHASVIAVAAVLAQLKGDAWWSGTAIWWISTREPGRLLDLSGLLLRSEYLCNLLTLGVLAWEIIFAVGLWFAPTQRLVARVALVVWPLIGLLVAEPLWGLTMASFTIPLAGLTLAPASDSAAYEGA
jgi:hypothetical protein